MPTSNKMIIPDNINVGYQNRDGTYTGKLAYVVYTDSKGVLRKEKSWNSWRDNKIKPSTFTNEPTSGFVLNKGVGGTRESYGWNPRNEYIRVFDPRGFEFEISVANLLFILQETTSTKGKGLEGEFVYAWDGADLVLLPTGSNEYVACSKYTDHQLGKVDKKDIVEGCTYLMKDMSKVMYLGRHDWYDYNYDYYGNHAIKHLGKKHVFINLEKDGDYITQTGFTRLAERLTNDVSPDYANSYETFKNSIHASSQESVQILPRKIYKKDIKDLWSYLEVLVKEGDDYVVADIGKHRDWKLKEEELKDKYELVKRRGAFKPALVDGYCVVPQRTYDYHYSVSTSKLDKQILTETELLSIQFFTVVIVCKNGFKHNILER